MNSSEVTKLDVAGVQSENVWPPALSRRHETLVYAPCPTPTVLEVGADHRCISGGEI